MNKLEELLNKIDSQKRLYYCDMLTDAKLNFEESTIKAIKENPEMWSDKELDILLKEDNLPGTLLNRSINWHLEVEEKSCGWQDLKGFIEHKKLQKRHSSDKEM